MIDVREVIAEAIPCNIVYGRPQAADEIIRALHTAGFRILGPDEVDQLRDDIHVAIMSMSGDCEAHHRIAFNHLDQAYRAIGRKA